MFPTVTLLVTRGPLAGQKFTFTKQAVCTIGRARDCTISLPLDLEHLDISRHHCLLELSPPTIRVRDLGSLNGTFVNGRKIGQRAGRESPADLTQTSAPTVELTAGDEVQLGDHTAFRVCIVPSTSARKDTSQTQRASSGEMRV